MGLTFLCLEFKSEIKNVISGLQIVLCLVLQFSEDLVVFVLQTDASIYHVTIMGSAKAMGKVSEALPAPPSRPPGAIEMLRRSSNDCSDTPISKRCMRLWPHGKIAIWFFKSGAWRRRSSPTPRVDFADNFLCYPGVAVRTNYFVAVFQEVLSASVRPVVYK